MLGRPFTPKILFEPEMEQIGGRRLFVLVGLHALLCSNNTIFVLKYKILLICPLHFTFIFLYIFV
jgi:hypothetical protein